MRLTRRRFFFGMGAAAIAPMLPSLGDWTTGPEWIPFTPTFTGFGTVTEVAMSRRVGDTLEIKGTLFLKSLSAIEARVILST